MEHITQCSQSRGPTDARTEGPQGAGGARPDPRRGRGDDPRGARLRAPTVCRAGEEKYGALAEALEARGARAYAVPRSLLESVCETARRRASAPASPRRNPPGSRRCRRRGRAGRRAGPGKRRHHLAHRRRRRLRGADARRGQRGSAVAQGAARRNGFRVPAAVSARGTASKRRWMRSKRADTPSSPPRSTATTSIRDPTPAGRSCWSSAMRRAASAPRRSPVPPWRLKLPMRGRRGIAQRRGRRRHLHVRPDE